MIIRKSQHQGVVFSLPCNVVTIIYIFVTSVSTNRPIPTITNIIINACTPVAVDFTKAPTNNNVKPTKSNMLISNPSFAWCLTNGLLALISNGIKNSMYASQAMFLFCIASSLGTNFGFEVFVVGATSLGCSDSLLAIFCL